MDSSWAADPAHGVEVFLLESIASPPARRFLFVNTGTREALCNMHEAFNRKGLFRKLKEALPASEAEAIAPVPSHENFDLPGMHVLPGDHLKPFADAILRNEYARVEVAAPEMALQAVSRWKEEQDSIRQKITDIGSRVVRCTIPCARDWKVSDVKVFGTDGSTFIKWTCPSCGRNYLEGL
jgi:hypothetical protein